MKKSTYSQLINAPIEKVFEVVDSDNHIKNWMEGFIENVYEKDFDTNHPVGGKFKQKLKEGGKIQEYDGQIISYNRPKELGIRLMSPSFDVDVYYRFFSEGNEKTRLEYECNLKMHSFIAQIMGSLFSWFTKRIHIKQINALKSYAEKRFDGVL